MNDLNSLVRSVAVGAGSNGYYRTADVGAILALELVNVTEVLGGLEAGGYLELPFQYLPFVVIALHLRPGRVVGDRLHFVALAIDRTGAAAITIDHRIDVNVETENIFIQERVGRLVNLVVNAV